MSWWSRVRLGLAMFRDNLFSGYGKAVALVGRHREDTPDSVPAVTLVIRMRTERGEAMPMRDELTRHNRSDFWD